MVIFFTPVSLITFIDVNAAPPVASGTAISATGTTSPLILGSHTVVDGSNRLLLVNVGIKDTTGTMVTVSSVIWGTGTDCADNAESLTSLPLASLTHGTGNERIRSESWYLTDATVRTGDVCITVSDSNFDRITAAVVNYDYVDKDVPIPQSGTNSGDSSTISGSQASKFGDILFAHSISEKGNEICQ